MAERRPGDKDDCVRQASWTDHFNGRMPLIDVDGLRPAGPGARPPARPHRPPGRRRRAMRIADHYLPRRRLRERRRPTTTSSSADHPKSPLLQRAQLGSIDAKMKGYLGPEYDAAGLEKARS